MTVERAQVDAYAAVCGFPTKDVAPLPYPHMLAFPLHMAIMTDTAFPAPAIGTVHLENSITGYRAIAVGESLSVLARVGASKPHPKGTIYEFVTEVRSADDDDLVWESTSTYLRRGKGDDAAPSGSSLPDAPAGTIEWQLAADLGRRYAAVSGDHNPIHLYPLTAKALGLPPADRARHVEQSSLHRRAGEPAARPGAGARSIQEADLPARERRLRRGRRPLTGMRSR